MDILIDADGCPVTKQALQIAKEYGVEVTIVCDAAHQFGGAKVITVSTGADNADFTLVNLVHPGDIVITQDYGLAAMALAKGARAIDQNGRIYDERNIDSLLLSRQIAKKIRRGGGRLKGPPKRKPEQDVAFEKAFRMLLDEVNNE